MQRQQKKKDLWTLYFAEKTHNKIKSDQHDTWRRLNWKTTKWRRSHRPGKEWIAPKIVERYNNDWIQKARIKKWKMKKNFANAAAAASPGSGHQWRNQEDQRSRTSWWIEEPELRDELSEACNGHRAAEYDWIRLQLADAKESWNPATLYFEKMVYVDEGRTDGPRSLPLFSFLLIKVSLSKCCTDSEESHDIRNQNSDEFASAIDSALFVLFFFLLM